MNISPREQQRSARHQRASPNDRVMRMPEMCATSGLSRWTLYRAWKRGELKLLKLSANALGARESEFWRWIDSKGETAD